MSREPKRMEENESGSGKIIFYILVAVAIVVTIVVYTITEKNIQERNELERLAEIENQEKIAEQESLVVELGSAEDENIESVSTQIGKTVEESSKENETLEETASSISTTTPNESKITQNDTTETASEKKNNETVSNETKTEEEPKKEITFAMPVDGEIVRGFAKDSLVYSETLQEWIVHQAIDIKENSRDVV